MSSPETLAPSPDPASWLGRDRYASLEPDGQWELTVYDQRGVLRGVRAISWDRLAKALDLTATPLGLGQYLVTHPGDRVGYWHYDVEPDPALRYVGYLWSDARGTWVEDPAFQTPGYEVNLHDRDVDRCFCEDFLFRCEAEATVCKHILAALIADGHPLVRQYVEELQRRQAVAASMTKTTKKTRKAILNGLLKPSTDAA
jgi:hypothetical protein